MQATVTDYRYVPSSTYVKQRVKNNYRPRGAVHGGNGSFRMAVPPQVIVRLEGKRGKTYDIDIYPDLHDYFGFDGKRVTESRASKICESMLGQSVELSSNHRSIENISDFLPD